MIAFVITDECINCGACKYECPYDAVSEPEYDNMTYSFENHYFILNDKCKGCRESDEIKCYSVCPMDAIKKISN